MTSAAASHTTNLAISVSDLNTTVNCEPRVRDLRLAEALGFVQPLSIRKLIRQHMAVLGTFGEVFAERKKPGTQGGRPGTDFWLNKRQALFITAKSDTERAALVTVQMVEVFDALTSGKLPVRAYTRAPRKSALFDGSQPGRGCVVLGKPVFFDAGRRPAVGEPALVVLHDGTLAVFPICEEWTRPKPGYVYVEDKGPPKGVSSCQSRVALIGAVTTPAGRMRRIAK